MREGCGDIPRDTCEDESTSLVVRAVDQTVHDSRDGGDDGVDAQHLEMPRGERKGIDSQGQLAPDQGCESAYVRFIQRVEQRDPAVEARRSIAGSRLAAAVAH